LTKTGGLLFPIFVVGTKVKVAQKSFLAIGGNNVVVALTSVGQMLVALTLVGEKLHHRLVLVS
jgi:hypothetical protein